MKNIFIALPPVFPIPAVKGGAVETLVEMLLQENEKNPRFNFTVFSTDDKKARQLSMSYRYTKFIYIANKKPWPRLKYFFARAFHRIFNLYFYFLDDYHGSIFKYIKNNIPDLFVAEGGSYTDEFKKISGVLGPDKMCLHIHLCMNAPKKIENIFSNIISVSLFAAQPWQENKKLRIFVLKNCIKTSAFQLDQQKAEKLRAQLAFEIDDFVVIFCGRIVRGKGVTELAGAVIREDRQKVKLMIVGSADFNKAGRSLYLKELRRIAASCKSIKFTGYVEHEDLPIYYQAAQVAVIPSIFKDAAPLVAIEAMAAGKPIIMTNSGGVREYVPSEGSIVVDRNNIEDELNGAFVKLMDDLDVCRQMGDINRSEAQKYNEVCYFDNFSGILEKLTE